jgi:alpha-L-fucosidase
MTDDLWADLARLTPDWFRRAKLGIFIHWGPYSVPAWAEPIGPLGTIDGETWFAHNPYSEWYFNTIRIEGTPAAVRHRELYGEADSEEFTHAWTAERFDPESWADLFAAVGADYVVPTAKHHDGFALWDAPGTGPRNAVRRGPRRDLVGAIAGAVRSRGMRFGAYYSGGLDWSVTPHLPPHRGHEEVSSIRPRDAAYNYYAISHVRDLIERYRPSMLWNDIEWPDAGKRAGRDGLAELFADYYAAVPDGVVNDRWGVPHRDFLCSEYEAGGENETDVWQNTRGLGYSFGYNRAEDGSTSMSGPELARYWTDVVARGGHLLLNVGPTAEGEIPEVQRRALEEFASWRQGVGDVAEVAAWDEPAHARGPADGPWVRYWRLPGEVVALVGDAGRHSLTLPTGQTVEVVVDDVSKGPAALRFPA